jgi:hypothetical protein
LELFSFFYIIIKKIIIKIYMGWAGPATEEVGPISAQNGWADLGLTLFIFFIGVGPDLAQNFGLGQIRPDPTSTT